MAFYRSSRTASGTLALLRVAFSVALVSALLYIVDVGRVASHLRSLAPLVLLQIVFLLYLQMIVAAGRWYVVHRLAAAAPASAASMFRIFLLAQSANQVLPTSIGGDALRTALLARGSVSAYDALRSVLADRVSGLWATMLALALASLALLSLDPASADRALYALALGLSGAVLLVGAAAPRAIGYCPATPFWGGLADLMAPAVRALFRPRVLVLSAINLSLTWIAYLAIAAAFDVPISPLNLLWTVQIMALAQIIPLGYGGWGIREVSFVGVIASFGVDPAAAAAMAVAYGACLLTTGAPGLALILLGRGAGRKYELA